MIHIPDALKPLPAMLGRLWERFETRAHRHIAHQTFLREDPAPTLRNCAVLHHRELRLDKKENRN
jgi:hypothetical protein